jgi:hypothetical protein
MFPSVVLSAAKRCVCALYLLCNFLGCCCPAGKRKRGRPARSQVQPEPSGDGADAEAGEDEDGTGEDINNWRVLWHLYGNPRRLSTLVHRSC